MKRTLLLLLAVFAGVSMYANTDVQPVVRSVAHKAVPTPDFTYRVTTLWGTNPLIQYATIYLTTPLPADLPTVANVNWDFGDGSAPAVNARPLVNHVYQPVTYTVTLTLTYVTGEVFVITKEVVIALP
ncbi:PKD domain-containing protein [Chitinophaga sp. S165]|uniref:PKD domain-containing protein n=1 Tax=Chitinophaga sp. S165 TaxID=2135462 RepID=UPI000D714A51|nr:PKD domain-containing protein [Chitinophaga sp. S165]PWV56149.1 PKD domain-containing protein [Chitinophaga sp. S165]